MRPSLASTSAEQISLLRLSSSMPLSRAGFYTVFAIILVVSTIVLMPTTIVFALRPPPSSLPSCIGHPHSAHHPRAQAVSSSHLSPSTPWSPPSA
jgi:hypothetical protein